MAVITAVELQVYLQADHLDFKRVGRLHSIAKAAVDGYAPAASDDLKTESIIRVAAYMAHDDATIRPLSKVDVDGIVVQPAAPGSALRRSGAMALLAPYRVRRAPGSTDAA